VADGRDHEERCVRCWLEWSVPASDGRGRKGQSEEEDAALVQSTVAHPLAGTGDRILPGMVRGGQREAFRNRGDLAGHGPLRRRRATICSLDRPAARPEGGGRGAPLRSEHRAS